MRRPSKKQYYLDLAEAVSARSPCPEGKRHGAVIVVNDRPVATGYNGPPRKWDHCLISEDSTCPLDVAKAQGMKDWTVCPAVHAEVNVVITAALSGTIIAKGTIYMTKKPCVQCARFLANCGFKNIYWRQE